MSQFRDDLAKLINQHSMETGSKTPDFILATYLEGALRSFEIATRAREDWYGLSKRPVGDPR